MSSKVEDRRSTLNRIIETVGDLPSASEVLSKAIRLSSDLDSDIKSISSTISGDQSISGKVIRVSNSPHFAQNRRVASLDDAIKVLGFNEVKWIIVNASAFQLFDDCAHIELATRLWHHSFSTAIAARLIAERFTSLDKDEAYLAGLMHDVGKLTLLKTSPEVYTKIIEVVKTSNSDFTVEERKELGFDHVDLGVALLEKWNFPRNIVTAVANHHRCNLTAATSSEQLARVVALANGVSRYIGTDFFDPYETTIEEEYYLGPDVIEGDRIIQIQCDAESQFNTELSRLDH